MKKEVYAIAYKEVLEILKYLEEEDYKKIPEKMIQVFETFCDKEYEFNYDPNLTLDENHISKIGKAIIAILYRDYWASDEERREIIKKENEERLELEEEKRKRYNPDELFKKNVDNTEESDQKAAEITIYKQSIFVRIRQKIKEILKRS